MPRWAAIWVGPEAPGAASAAGSSPACPSSAALVHLPPRHRHVSFKGGAELPASDEPGEQILGTQSNFASPFMCYPDPSAARGPRGGVPFKCFQMAQLGNPSGYIPGGPLESSAPCGPLATALLLGGSSHVAGARAQRRSVQDFL